MSAHSSIVAGNHIIFYFIQRNELLIQVYIIFLLAETRQIWSILYTRCTFREAGTKRSEWRQDNTKRGRSKRSTTTFFLHNGWPLTDDLTSWSTAVLHLYFYSAKSRRAARIFSSCIWQLRWISMPIFCISIVTVLDFFRLCCLCKSDILIPHVSVKRTVRRNGL